jgi:hypothetical protein
VAVPKSRSPFAPFQSVDTITVPSTNAIVLYGVARTDASFVKADFRYFLGSACHTLVAEAPYPSGMDYEVIDAQTEDSDLHRASKY